MGIVKLFTTVASDFEVLFLAAKDLFTQQNPYLNPNIFTGVGYPPNTLLFYIPLTKLPYMIAQNIFTTISIVCLFLSIYMSIRLIKRTYTLVPAIFITFFSLISFPTRFTFGMGQNNLIAITLFLTAIYLSRSKNIFLSGVLLGLAISLKTIFIYLIIYFIFKRQFKIVFYALVVLLMTTFAIYVIRGSFDLYFYYINNVVPPLLNYLGREIYYNQGLSGLTAHIFDNLNYREFSTSILTLIVIFINSLYLSRKNDDNGKLSLSIVCLLLIDSLAWQHHFVWLIFPFIYTAYNSFNNFKSIFTIALSYILISINVPQFSLLSLNVFFGNLILFLYILNNSK